MSKKLICCAICFIVSVFMASAAYAEEAEKSDPLPEIEAIRSLPKIDTVEDTSAVKKERKFDGIATIARISGNKIVMEDDLYRLSSNATLYSKKGKRISQSSFREGDEVGFITNPANKYEIMSLWKLRRGK